MPSRQRLQEICEQIAQKLPGEWGVTDLGWMATITRSDSMVRFSIDDSFIIIAEVAVDKPIPTYGSATVNTSKSALFRTKHRSPDKVVELLIKNIPVLSNE